MPAVDADPAGGGGSPTQTARHFRLLAECLLAEGRDGEAADALRAGLLAIENITRSAQPP